MDHSGASAEDERKSMIGDGNICQVRLTRGRAFVWPKLRNKFEQYARQCQN